MKAVLILKFNFLHKIIKIKNEWLWTKFRPVITYFWNLKKVYRINLLLFYFYLQYCVLTSSKIHFYSKNIFQIFVPNFSCRILVQSHLISMKIKFLPLSLPPWNKSAHHNELEKSHHKFINELKRICMMSYQWNNSCFMKQLFDIHNMSSEKERINR